MGNITRLEEVDKRPEEHKRSEEQGVAKGTGGRAGVLPFCAE